MNDNNTKFIQQCILNARIAQRKDGGNKGNEYMFLDSPYTDDGILNNLVGYQIPSTESITLNGPPCDSEIDGHRTNTSRPF
jgi:hypothetical protein